MLQKVKKYFNKKKQLKNKLDIQFIQDCYKTFQSLDMVTRYGVGVPPTQSDYIYKYPFLATQEIFEAYDNDKIVIAVIKSNPKLATQENFIIQYHRCLKELNAKGYYICVFLTLEYFLKANPKLATQENFNLLFDKDAHISSLIINLNKKLATQENFDKTNKCDIRHSIIKHNKKLATLDNYYKCLENNFSFVRNFILNINPKIITEKLLELSITENEKLTIIRHLTK